MLRGRKVAANHDKCYRYDHGHTHEIIQAVHQVLMEYFERVPIGGLDGVALAPDEADSLGSDVVALLKSQKGLGGRSDV